MPEVGDEERADFSPGAALRSARVARGLSVEEVAHALKLAPRQIEAIEADAFDRLRGLTFARGFVRNYARHLGLDAEPLVAAIVSDV
ncbi:MAG TPA: helix-turn-helix transcriptional regulator, partial [Rhodocyclaceae bacterium]|nr:helix-turn-helix transcriptional regulator [Rhodocyclaceae bacterium]